MTIVSLNGRLVPLAQARIPITDRSYLFGEGIFETLRVYDGHPAFLAQHYERLCSNAAALRIPLPLTASQCARRIAGLLAANRLRDATVRLCVSPYNADLALERSSHARSNIVLFARRPALRAPALYQRGARVMLIHGLTGDAPTVAAIKSTSYVSKMLARQHVRDAALDEGIFVTPRGIVLEGTATNLFAIRRNVVLTPPISDGVLPGVTRSVVLQLAHAAGMRCREMRLTTTSLRAADAVFLTGSSTEILPVREIIGMARYAPRHELIAELSAHYAAAIAADRLQVAPRRATRRP